MVVGIFGKEIKKVNSFCKLEGLALGCDFVRPIDPAKDSVCLCTDCMTTNLCKVGLRTWPLVCTMWCTANQSACHGGMGTERVLFQLAGLLYHQIEHTIQYKIKELVVA